MRYLADQRGSSSRATWLAQCDGKGKKKKRREGQAIAKKWDKMHVRTVMTNKKRERKACNTSVACHMELRVSGRQTQSEAAYVS